MVQLLNLNNLRQQDEMKQTFLNLLMPLVLLLVVTVTTGQDLHYADIQSMNLWYNQSLKMDKYRDLRLNFRDIKYQSLIAFRTASGMLNVPLIRKEQLDDSRKGFLSATAAGAFDKSNRGIFKNNTGMLGLSYAQKLSDNDMYISVGFQGTMTRTMLNTSTALFPDQFDRYGPIPSGTRDRFGVGRSYNWASLNAGLSVYQNSESADWYVGASMRHINRPFTDENKNSQYRLAPTFGMQAGVTVKNEMDQVGLYAIANWKAEAYEYLIGAKLTKQLDEGDGESEGTALGVGLALRLRDAIIPNLQLRFNKTTLGFHYDVNISGLKAAGYTRNGFELALFQRLN